MLQTGLSRTLLLVDDNEINLKILTKILCGQYKLLTAKNGQEALDVLRGEHGRSICAVVLDLIMPVMDGYEVLRRMRADKELALMPVIVASGHDENGSDAKEVLALSLGANDYVIKPYKAEIIRHRLANTIYLRETAAFVNTVQHDSLTGLYNKEYFYRRVEGLLKTNPGRTYDMVCCDIERFKLVNDLYGMERGDRLLETCAELIRQLLDDKDTAGRLGPDLFAWIWPHRESYDNHLFEDIERRLNNFGIQLNITLRYGIYVISDPTLPANLICDRACLAKATIKGLYGVYYKFYDDALRQKLVNEQYIISHMKSALESGEFVVYFQPKYELKSERIIGAEALVRWDSAEKGFLSPGQFIPLFEKNGFITDLDRYVWETACQELRQWLDTGHMAIPISVNVSRADLYNPHIHSILLSLINKYALSPKYLSLEITESVYTENPQQLINTVNELKRMGFLIEMDDFGTGYSSLNMLSELPIDVVKLDIGFMQNHKKYNGRSVLSFIISLTKWMNLGVIAEGVENAEQVNLLRSLGCECAQGYYYARPMPPADFERLLLQQFSQPQPVKPDEADLPSVGPAGVILTMDFLDTDTTAFERMFAGQYLVVRASSSQEALSLLKDPKTDIKIVLYTLGEVFSLEALGPVAALCRSHAIPLLTLHEGSQDAVAAIQAGACDYIEKPYVEAAVRERILNTIGNVRTAQLEREREINGLILEMKKRAEQDSLTGLLNRAEFENRVQEFFFHNPSPDSAFIMVDVDNFKKLNDSCGHVAGDSALQTLALAMHRFFPETNVIGRMGGDEFALFLPHRIAESTLRQKCSLLCSSLRREEDGGVFSCSIGICVAPALGMDFQTLYERADIALLHAKQNGKSQFQFYEKGMETPIDENFAQRAAQLLDRTSDALFVCDAVTSELIYINDTACALIHKSRSACLGKRCYELFWEQCRNCDRCSAISHATECFYEEDTVMKDGQTKIHIRAKTDTWDGRRVKIHYLHLLV